MYRYIFLLLLLTLFAWPAYGDQPAICSDPKGYVLSKVTPKVLDRDCSTDGLCGLVVETPLRLSDRPFMSFVLYLSQGERGQISLANEVNDSNGVATTSFWLHENILKEVSISAVYEIRAGCLLVSTLNTP